MTITTAIILGLLQALGEFLPISSSAHLVLFSFFTGNLSCVFWQDILGLVSAINQSSKNYIPLKQKSALDYFKLKDFLARNNFNFSAGYISALQAAFMDMQNALIMPQDLLKIEELDSSLSSKDLRDLIFIYENYLTLTKQAGTQNYKDFFVCALDNIEKNN